MAAEREAVREFFRENGHNLITPAGISARTGASPAVVSNWFRRWPGLGELVVTGLNADGDSKYNKIYWWPDVREWLAEHHVPFTDPGSGCEHR
jgi:hypothetical protein